MAIRVACQSSGFVAGQTRYTKNGRQGWCVHCGKWRAVRSNTAKFKRHAESGPTEASEPLHPESRGINSP